MTDLTIRLGILLLAIFLTWLLVKAGSQFVARQRRRALAARPLALTEIVSPGSTTVAPLSTVRILSFSSPDCRQCHQLQAPALQRLLQARGDMVSVVDLDATVEQELTQNYHILTVPSTVVLDGQGSAQAINYGFANTQRLLEQVDAILKPSLTSTPLLSSQTTDLSTITK